MNNKPDYTIYCDGGARGNPGPAAYGFVIYDSNGSKKYEEGGAIGITTNNVAEYSAVVAALKYVLSIKYPFESFDKTPFGRTQGKQDKSAQGNKVLSIRFFLDSQLVAEQLSGRWKIKNESLRNFFFTIKDLEQKIGAKFSYFSVPREQNKEADRLVNLALDA